MRAETQILWLRTSRMRSANRGCGAERGEALCLGAQLAQRCGVDVGRKRTGTGYAGYHAARTAGVAVAGL